MRKLYAFLAVATVIAAIWSGIDFARHFADYQPELSPYAPKIALLRLLQAATGLLPLLLIAKTVRRENCIVPGELSGLQPLRRFFLCALLALIATSIVQAQEAFASSSMLQRSFFLAAIFLCAEIWAALCCAFPGGMSRAPKLKAWNVISVNMLLLLALCEGMLTVAAKVSDSQIFWNQDAIESSLARYRLKPHQAYFNFRVNSLGYHDEEFFVAGEQDCAVALLADSFGVGVVPYDYNFATIAENKLRAELGGRCARVALHNFGVSAIGMHHYAWLLENEVLKYNPREVVLCVFVGNDIDGLKKTKSSRYALQDWWLWKIPARLAILGRQGASAEVGAIGTPQQPGQIPEHIEQPEKEKPTFTRDKFLEIERIRLDQICNTSRGRVLKNYSGFFEALDFFRNKLGSRLRLVLIPDEFQVNDALYAETTSVISDLSVYDREYPQKRITEFCREKNIRQLDLLPVLREAEKSGHTYHLQDTHWNARGNRVAGEALAEFLSADFAPPQP